MGDILFFLGLAILAQLIIVIAEDNEQRLIFSFLIWLCALIFISIGMRNVVVEQDNAIKSYCTYRYQTIADYKKCSTVKLKDFNHLIYGGVGYFNKK